MDRVPKCNNVFFFVARSKWDDLLGIEQTDIQQKKFQENYIEDPSIRKAVALVFLPSSSSS